MSVKLLTEHNLEFISLTGGCTGSSASTLVKMILLILTKYVIKLNLNFCANRSVVKHRKGQSKL